MHYNIWGPLCRGETRPGRVFVKDYTEPRNSTSRRVQALCLRIIFSRVPVANLFGGCCPFVEPLGSRPFISGRPLPIEIRSRIS